MTAAYNSQMRTLLPASGIEVVEIPRLEREGAAVSASRLRALLDAGDVSGAEELAPPATRPFLRRMQA